MSQQYITKCTVQRLDKDGKRESVKPGTVATAADLGLDDDTVARMINNKQLIKKPVEPKAEKGSKASN